MSVNEKMTAIADSIRSYGNISGKLNLDEMANKIGTVYLNGYDLGRVQGEEAGFSEGKQQGYSLGFEEGKIAERNAFWDVFQNYGNEAGQNYNNAFSYERFTDAIYNPIHPIITSTSSTAAQTIFIYSVITDTKVPIICQGNRMNQTFAYSYIQKIPELNVHESVVFDRTFYSASYITELYITGTIGQNGFNVQWSKNLNKASIESIINALSTTTSGLTVTLSLTAVDNAFATGGLAGSTTAEWMALEATKTNWTISLV